MLIHIPAEEYAAVLDAIVAEALAEAAIARPPVDPFAIARTLGITVAEDAEQSGRARYVRLRGAPARRPRPTVLLRPDPRPERCHWALAHEIGEHWAHQVFGRLAIDPQETGPGAREAVANELARRLLVPSDWYRGDGTALAWDLVRLKARYRTASHELLARRMLDLPQPVIVTIIDQGRLYLRRGNLPGQVPPLSETEKACRRIAHQEDRPIELLAEGQKVQAWPIHEPGWKREILRTEIDSVPW